MEYRDYYATLGCPGRRRQADIKKAFRKLARKHHPDVNTGDGAAERALQGGQRGVRRPRSDPEKRKLYDQLGANWEAYQRGGAPGADPFAGVPGSRGLARRRPLRVPRRSRGPRRLLRLLPHVLRGWARMGRPGVPARPAAASAPASTSTTSSTKRPAAGAPSGAGRAALARSRTRGATRRPAPRRPVRRAAHRVPGRGRSHGSAPVSRRTRR